MERKENAQEYAENFNQKITFFKLGMRNGLL